MTSGTDEEDEDSDLLDAFPDMGIGKVEKFWGGTVSQYTAELFVEQLQNPLDSGGRCCRSTLSVLYFQF